MLVLYFRQELVEPRRDVGGRGKGAAREVRLLGRLQRRESLRVRQRIVVKEALKNLGRGLPPPCP